MAHKYLAIKTKCFKGHIHPSRWEAKVCNDLYALMSDKKKGILNIEHEPKFELFVNDKLITVHRPDFLLHTEEGIKIKEAKGKEMPDWKLKMKLFKALYPHIPYEVISDPRWNKKKKSKIKNKKLRKVYK